jgi:DDE superfamily endonuclease
MANSRKASLASNLGELPCRHPTHPPSPLPTSSDRTSSAWSALTPLRKHLSAASAWSCVPLTRTSPPTCRSPRNSAPAITPSACGVDASPSRASPACRTLPGPAARRSFPPSQRLHVLELATTEDPATAGCPSGSWSLDDLALTILQEANEQDWLLAHLAAAHEAAARALAEEELAASAALLPPFDLRPMSRSTVHRILTEADLKPHRSNYWLNSHDPDFRLKAEGICQLYLDAPRLWQAGELVLSSDEKTGILIRRRKHPSKPTRPGRPHRREHEYERLGSTHLSASFCVPTGQVAYDLSRTHNGDDFVAHLRHAVAEMPEALRYHWVVDNNRTHSTPAVCALVAELSGLPAPQQLQTGKDRRRWLCDPEHKHVFHFTPVHGSWLNQVEMFFSVLTRKLLKRDDFASAEGFVQRLQAWMAYYNKEWAHPYKWTYAGTPLVRDTPFEQTRRQQKRGRAFFSPRPKCFERLFYPPRPYHKAVPA